MNFTFKGRQIVKLLAGIELFPNLDWLHSNNFVLLAFH